MSQFMIAWDTIHNHADSFWVSQQEKKLVIELTKVDVSTDLKGSFLPKNPKEAF